MTEANIESKIEVKNEKPKSNGRAMDKKSSISKLNKGKPVISEVSTLYPALNALLEMSCETNCAYHEASSV